MSEKRVTRNAPGRLVVAKIAGNNIRMLRRARGMSQTDLAGRLTEAGFQINYLTVQKIETCSHPSGSGRSLSVDELVAFARALDVRPEQLLTRFRCEICNGEPPQGFICASCGASGKAPDADA